ncbi:MAG: peptidase U32 family protein [Candidatus Woesearchaeota archaeon]
MNTIELLAPVGSFAALQGAIDSGTHAIYFGAGNLQMRSKTAAFSLEDIQKVTTLCHKHKIHAYLTVNTVVYDSDMQAIKTLLTYAKQASIDAIIACDIAVITLAREMNIPVHISTQANVSNIEAVKFFSQFAQCIVLARELTLTQIQDICQQIQKQHICGPNGKLVKIETFIHGALCIAISGKCHMSLHSYNSSANRGNCFQACRKSYRVFDSSSNTELEIDNNYVMSPSDLCTLPILDRIIDAGVQVLKIEGRGRAPEYVKTIVEVYASALKHIAQNTYTRDVKDELVTKARTVYNRDFWMNGYYLGEKISEWSKEPNSKATKTKSFVGLVENYYQKSQVAHIILQTGEVHVGDTLLIIGETTGVIEHVIDAMQVNDMSKSSAHKGDFITFKIATKLRKNDQAYVYKEKEKN